MDYNASNMNVGAQKLWILKHEYLTHIFNPAAKKIQSNLSLLSNNGQQFVLEEYYDIAVKFTFDLLDIKHYLHEPVTQLPILSQLVYEFLTYD